MLFQGFFPGYDLDDAVEYASREYEEDFAEYWGLDASSPPEHLEFDQWREYKEIHSLAKRLAVAASTLVRPRRLSEDHRTLPGVLQLEAAEREQLVTEALEQLKERVSHGDWWQLWNAFRPTDPSDPRTKRDFLLNCVQIEATKLFPGSPAPMAARMLTLVNFLVRNPGERTRAYLSRVAECYLRGMKTEFAVMCRAVLDTALQDFVSDEEVRRTVGAGRNVGMERRIECCRAKRVFDVESTNVAKRIKDSGDNAVHLAPGLEPDPDRLLEDLVTILTCIEKGRT